MNMAAACSFKRYYIKHFWVMVIHNEGGI